MRPLLYLLSVASVGVAISCSRDDGKTKKLVVPVVAITACPPGATLDGDVPPAGFRQRCQREATERHGASREWYEDGRERAYSEWWHGEKHGRFSIWFKDGKVRSVGAHRFGQPAGKWTYYAEDGKVLQEKTFEVAPPSEDWVAQAIAGNAPVRDVVEPAAPSSEVTGAGAIPTPVDDTPVKITAPTKAQLNAPPPAYTAPPPDPTFSRGTPSQ